jgi:hypothetical protein
MMCEGDNRRVSRIAADGSFTNQRSFPSGSFPEERMPDGMKVHEAEYKQPLSGVCLLKPFLIASVLVWKSSIKLIPKRCILDDATGLP